MQVEAGGKEAKGKEAARIEVEVVVKEIEVEGDDKDRSTEGEGGSKEEEEEEEEEEVDVQNMSWLPVSLPVQESAHNCLAPVLKAATEDAGGEGRYIRRFG